MSQLGIGTMNSNRAVQSAIGKKIAKIEFDGDCLRFFFEKGKGVALWDDGQNCCEKRYMTCDDDLTGYNGDVVVSIEEAAGDYIEEEYDLHETAFLVIKTDRGVITACTHNEHNGYYGGFNLTASEFDHDFA